MGGQGLSQSLSLPLFDGWSAAVFVGIAVLMLFISILNPQGMSGLRMKASDAITPVLNAVVSPIAKAADVVRNISGLSELQAENLRLQQENIKLKEWYQTALLLEAENKSLRDLLNVKVEPHYKSVTARVLADSGNAFVKSALIAAGSHDGLKKGQAVLSGDGLVGRVTELGEQSARVLLITDINSRVPVLIEDTRQHAVLAGDNQDLAKLLYLPPDTTVNQGARIITSGHGGMFPPGLAIGKVIKTKDGQIRVQPFAEFTRMTHVRVIDHNVDPNFVAGPAHFE